jgi:hypothetical protein
MLSDQQTLLEIENRSFEKSGTAGNPGPIPLNNTLSNRTLPCVPIKNKTNYGLFVTRCLCIFHINFNRKKTSRWSVEQLFSCSKQ